MLIMSQINHIRDLRQCGYRISEIAKKVGADHKTIRKYLDKDNFSPAPPAHSQKPSILDPYKPKIQEYLAEDKKTLVQTAPYSEANLSAAHRRGTVSGKLQRRSALCENTPQECRRKIESGACLGTWYGPGRFWRSGFRGKRPYRPLEISHGIFPVQQ